MCVRVCVCVCVCLREKQRGHVACSCITASLCLCQCVPVSCVPRHVLERRSAALMQVLDALGCIWMCLCALAGIAALECLSVWRCVCTCVGVCVWECNVCSVSDRRTRCWVHYSTRPERTEGREGKRQSVCVSVCLRACVCVCLEERERVIVHVCFKSILMWACVWVFVWTASPGVHYGP